MSAPWPPFAEPTTPSEWRQWAESFAEKHGIPVPLDAGMLAIVDQEARSTGSAVVRAMAIRDRMLREQIRRMRKIRAAQAKADRAEQRTLERQR